MRGKGFVLFAVCLILAIFGVRVRAEEPASKLRVGVYDNRAIAVAYGASKFNPVGGKMKGYEKAKAMGDAKRMKELEIIMIA